MDKEIDVKELANTVVGTSKQKSDQLMLLF